MTNQPMKQTMGRKNGPNYELDDRLFRLQMHRKGLPEDIRTRLHHADTMYLMDQDDACRKLLEGIEHDLKERGIDIPELPQDLTLKP